MRSLDLNKQVIIFSAFRSELSDAVNDARHSKAIELLSFNGIRSKQVQGVYKGISEASIVTVIGNDAQRDLVMQVAREYNQESILILDADTRNARLYYLDNGQSESIGTFQVVSESEAKSRDAYTYDSSQGYYYVAK
jgi:hypothetical protein